MSLGRASPSTFIFPVVEITLYFNWSAEEVRLELTNPVKDSGFQDRCNSRYATPPNLNIPIMAERVGLEPTGR